MEKHSRANSSDRFLTRKSRGRSSYLKLVRCVAGEKRHPLPLWSLGEKHSLCQLIPYWCLPVAEAGWSQSQRAPLMRSVRVSCQGTEQGGKTETGSAGAKGGRPARTSLHLMGGWSQFSKVLFSHLFKHKLCFESLPFGWLENNIASLLVILKNIPKVCFLTYKLSSAFCLSRIISRHIIRRSHGTVVKVHIKFFLFLR